MYTAAYVEQLKSALKNSLAVWGMSPLAEVTVLTVSENATFLVRQKKPIGPQERPIPGSGGSKRLVSEGPVAESPVAERKGADTASPEIPSADNYDHLIVRVHRPHYHTLQEIQSELDWLKALKTDNAIEVVTPVPTLTGEDIIKLTLPTDPLNEGHVPMQSAPIYAVAFEFMAGDEPKVGASLSYWFTQLGCITAKLHSHSRRWQRPEGFVRKTWNVETMLGDKGYWGRWQENSGLTKDSTVTIQNAIGLLNKRLTDYGAGPEVYGLVHADLRLANLLVAGEQLQVIDFDDCGFCWFGYDFAAAISFYETDRFIPNLQAAWVEGYRTVAPFSERDEAELASFILLRRILLTAWLASHSETATADEFNPGFAEGTTQLAEHYLASTGRTVFAQRCTA